MCGLLLAANLFYLYSDRPSEEDAINKELADKDRMAAYNLDQLQTICIQQLQTENVQLDENIYLNEKLYSRNRCRKYSGLFEYD